MAYADTIRTDSATYNDIADKIDGILTRLYIGATGGSANAYTGTLSPAPSSYTDILGQPIACTPNFTNTGSATGNINGLGAKTIKHLGRALVGGEMVSGRLAVLIYNGTDLILVNHGGDWATWTPTFGTEHGGGSSYWNASVVNAGYQVRGSRVDFVLRAAGTTGTSDPTQMRFTLPITGANTNCQGGGWIVPGSGGHAAHWSMVSTTTVAVSNYNTSALGIGANRSFGIAGFYQI